MGNHRFRGQGKNQREDRPRLLTAIHFDTAAMGFHDFFGDGKSQAGTGLPARRADAQSVKFAKKKGPFRFRNPLAFVPDSESDVLVFLFDRSFRDKPLKKL
jgi:hypothetical protein